MSNVNGTKITLDYMGVLREVEDRRKKQVSKKKRLNNAELYERCKIILKNVD